MIVGRLARRLAPGFYRLVIDVDWPDRIEYLRCILNGREIGKAAAFHDPSCQDPVPSWECRFVVLRRGEQRFAVERFAADDEYPPREHARVRSIRAVPEEGPRLRAPEERHCGLDLWGWHASPWHTRTEHVGPGYFVKRVLAESHKWGSNFLQVYPYSLLGGMPGVTTEVRRIARIGFAADKGWNVENWRALLREVHARGMTIEEHGFPPQYVNTERQYRPEETYLMLRTWYEQNADLANLDPAECVDGWDIEEYPNPARAPRREGLSASDDDMLAAMHLKWSYNPGDYFNLCGHRANARLGPSHNLVWYWKGPNFVFTPCNGGRGNDTIAPIRLFPGSAGFRPRANDVFVGFQADSRPQLWSSRYGGANFPDWLILQAFDFARPRRRDWPRIHETALFWLGEGDASMPESLRDYVYIASFDPLKAAVTANHGSTGLDGSLAHQGTIGKARRDHGFGTEHRVNHAADSTFIQNRFLKLTRSARAPHGILECDLDGTANFSAHARRATLLEFVETTNLPEPALEKPLAGRRRLTVRRALPPGAYLLELALEAGSSVGIAEVRQDGRLIGRLDANDRPGGGHVAFTVLRETPTTLRVDCTRTPSQTSVIRVYRTEGAVRSLLTARGLKRRPTQAERPFADLRKNARFPGILGGRGPKRISLLFDGECMRTRLARLTVRNTGRRAASIKVAVNLHGFHLNRRRIREGARNDITDWTRPAMDEYACWAGQWSIPADGRPHVVVFPFASYSEETHHLTVCCDAGECHVRSVEIFRPPVVHDYALKGGNRAELVEHLGTNTTRYTVFNEIPAVEMATQGRGRPMGIRLGGYRAVHRGNAWSLSDPRGVLPGLRITVHDGSATLNGDTLRIEYAACGGRLEVALARLWPASRLPMDRIVRRVRLPARTSVKVAAPDGGSKVAMVEVVNPKDGPYLVRENGWWRVRGAQPIYDPDDEKKHLKTYLKWVEAGLPSGTVPMRVARRDLVKVVCTGKRETLLCRWGYIEGLVRPGPGCAYTVEIADLGRRGCRVRVLNTTPYLFAPSVEFRRPFGRIRLNGKPWAFFEGRRVLLPQKRGTYRIEVAAGEPGIPHVARTAARVSRAAFEGGTLTFRAVLPDFVRSLPERLEYHALVVYDKTRWLRRKMDGARLVRPGRRGDIIAFRPGSVAVHFTKI